MHVSSETDTLSLNTGHNSERCLSHSLSAALGELSEEKERCIVSDKKSPTPSKTEHDGGMLERQYVHSQTFITKLHTNNSVV